MATIREKALEIVGNQAELKQTREEIAAAEANIKVWQSEIPLLDEQLAEAEAARIGAGQVIVGHLVKELDEGSIPTLLLPSLQAEGRAIGAVQRQQNQLPKSIASEQKRIGQMQARIVELENGG